METVFNCSNYYHVGGISSFSVSVLQLQKGVKTKSQATENVGKAPYEEKALRSTSVLVCIWELNVLYYGYLKMF